MKNLSKIKQQLFEACSQFVNNRLRNLEQNQESNKNALFSETKSSAGDKHETGRAMIQLEMEKASQQIESIHQMKNLLSKIEMATVGKIISLGSLIITDKAPYYLSISMGKVEIEEIDYYCISSSSPIGQQLLGKSVGDTISFNRAKILKVF